MKTLNSTEVQNISGGMYLLCNLVDNAEFGMTVAFAGYVLNNKLNQLPLGQVLLVGAALGAATELAWQIAFDIDCNSPYIN